MSQLLRDQNQRTLQNEVRLLLQETTNLPTITDASHPVQDVTRPLQAVHTQYSDCDIKIAMPQPLSSLTHLSACLDPNTLDPSLLVCWEGHESTVDEYATWPTRPLCLRERRERVIEAIRWRNMTQKNDIPVEKAKGRTGRLLGLVIKALLRLSQWIKGEAPRTQASL